MMDRNREVRRGSMAAVNGSLRRRQQRSTNLRDSPEEDGGTEMQETCRLRDRDRDRMSKKDRDRERSSSRSKRRRGERSMHGINRDEGDDSSDESMDEEDDDEDEDATVTVRLPASATNPPPPLSSSSSSMQLQQVNQHVRKSFPVKAARPPAPAPSWKVAEEMIGVSIPRKARSCVAAASLKRSPECLLTHRQPSTLPAARPSPSSNTAVSPPSSSNGSIRKKQKQISGSKHHRPPSTKISNSSPSSEIEIEVAEVLFGMTRQSLPSSSSSSVPEAHQNLDPKEINRLSGEAKSRIPSPVSSPPASVLPSNNNIAALVATAPKRKRPKFDEESPTSPSGKAETELPSKMGAPASPLRSEKKMEAAIPAMENDNTLADVGDHKQDLAELESCNHSSEPKEVEQEITAATSKSKEAPCSDLNVNLEELTSAKGGQAPVADSPLREEKFSIDLMAPPSAPLGNSERDGLSEYEYAADHIFLESVKGMKLNTVNGEMELKAMETASVEGRSSGKSITNEVDIMKHAAIERRKLDLQLDLEKQDKDTLSLICSSEHQHQVKQQCKAPKIDPKLEKSAHPVSLPSTMPFAGWPGNFPHFGYIGQVPSLPAVIPIDGTSATSKTMQPPHFFPPQKLKRCATHCYIAQNIYYNQQFARMNSFWPPATAPPYGAKQYNLNVMPASEAAAIIGNPLQGGFPGRNLGLLPNKASPAVAMTYPGPPPKEKSSVAVAAASNTFMEAAQRKQFLLQQTPPQTGSSAAPPNMIHTPAAFIFPIGQQPAAAPRSAGSKSTPGIGNAPQPVSYATSAAPGSTPTCYPPTSMSFNYAGMPHNDAQYLAILQNNGYPFPIPAYRGANPSQAVPFFNGSFYSSQMMYPSSQLQLRQHQQLVANQQPPPHSQQGHQNPSTSSGSSSSQKHQSQRAPPPPAATAAGGNSHNFPGSKQHQHLLPPQARQLESEAGCEDSPSTADSIRVSNEAQKSIYGPNFGMSIHSQNFALISPAASGAAGGGSNHSEKQLAGNQQHLAGQAYAMSPSRFGGPADVAAAATVGAPGLNFSSMLTAAADAAYAARAQQHKKPHHEDRKSGDSGTVNANVACEEGKMMASGAGKAAGNGAQHSLSFSRPDNDHPISGILGNISEGPSRTLNLIQPPANGGRVTSRPSSATPASNSSAATATNPSTSSPHMQQTQQQHFVQLQWQQQQQQMQFQQQMSSRAAKSSSHNPNNPAMYSDRMPSGSPMARFPQTGLAGFPPSVIQGASAAQSSQWKASGAVATPGPSTSAVSSSFSVKNQLPQKHQQQQQQQGRAQQQQPSLLSSNQHQTHISSKAVGVTGQPHLSGGSSNSSLTSVSAVAMAAGSPQNSATKTSPGNGGNGSPRASSSSKSGPPPATLLSPVLPLQQQQQSQTAKNSPSSLSSNINSSSANNRNTTSILGQPHINAVSNSNSSAKFQQQSQQQQKQQSFHQPQLFFSNPYMQAAQSSQSNAAVAAANFYQQQQQQRRQSEQQSQQHTQQQLQPNSDPAKAAAAGSMKGLTPTSGEGSGILQNGPQLSSSSVVQQHPLMSATAFPYMHTMVSSVSVKPASDPKAATGSDNLHWKPEKR